jgi:hypothetical protein
MCLYCKFETHFVTAETNAKRNNNFRMYIM